MSSDVVRFESNERVDLADLLAAVDETLRANARHWGSDFISDPTGDRSWILSGFAVDSPVATQVRVTMGVGGRAILGQREGGQTFFGALTSEGDATRIIDIGSYSGSLTYGVYVRFELLSGESSSRAFWDPTGDGEEIAQTIPTRRLANWSMRIELTTPGAEWLRVATVSLDATPEVSAITDLRDLYFEGTVDSAYVSGWSSEGGGVANDRNADRQQYGVKDLHTFTQAMRQCLEDIKGRGLRRWWDRDIGGMNIGFDAAPVEDKLAVGDAEFGLFGDAIATPRIWFHGSGGSSDYIQYDRASDAWSFVIDGAAKAKLEALGLQLDGGLIVGFSDTPVADKVFVGDKGFGFDGSTIAIPHVLFDVGDYLQFIRASNHWNFIIGGSSAVVIEEDTPGSPTVRALDPALTSDDGGDIFFAGGPSGSDADKDGGDAVLSGGDATGDGSSKVEVRAATAGAAGAGARVAELYLRADGSAGDVGRVEILKPFIAEAPIGSAEPGVTGATNGTGHGVRAYADLTSPLRSALDIVPQSNDPSVPTNGNVYVNISTDQIAHYNAVLGRFQNLDSIVKATIASSTPVVEPDILTVFDQTYTVPLNTLRIGSVLRIRAWGTATWNAATALSISAYFDTFRIGGALLSTPISGNGHWRFEADAIFRSIGAAGSMQGWERMEFAEVGAEQMDLATGLHAAVPTNVNQDVTVWVQLLNGNANDSAQMDGFIVEVI